MCSNLPSFTFIIRLSIASLVLCLSIQATRAVAMDKRTFVHIVPPDKNAFHLVVVNTETSSSLFKSNGQFQAKVENSSWVARSIARFSVSRNLELAFEIPYLLKREQSCTDAAGVTQNILDSEGLGDADVQLTWQARDSRKGGLGLIAGAELKFPTGDEDRGLGSGTWDASLRSILSYGMSIGFPYIMAIYTDTGTDTVNGVRTNPSDDIYLAAGLKSRFWKKFGFNFMAYRYIGISETISENNGSRAVAEKHDAQGWKLYGRYQVTKALEWNIFYEKSHPEYHSLIINNMVISKQPDDKKRFGTMFKYFW